jgi:hypothetical protein
VTLTHFALPTALFFLERVYFYGCKKEFSAKAIHIHSADFTAIWIPPKIIA